jgi:hypothetical protein
MPGDDDSTQSAPANGSATPAEAKPEETVAQSLLRTKFTPATFDQYLEYCRGSKCERSGYVLSVDPGEKKGEVFITLGYVLGDPETSFDINMRNRKDNKAFGKYYLASVLCNPPSKKAKTDDNWLYYRDCRFTKSDGKPYDVDALNAESDARQARKHEFSVTVEGYEGKFLYGYVDNWAGKASYRIEFNDPPTTRTPPGGTARVACYGERIAATTNAGNLVLDTDCFQIGGSR